VRAIAREPIKRISGVSQEPLPKNLISLADKASDYRARQLLAEVAEDKGWANAAKLRLSIKEEAARGRFARAIGLAKDIIRAAKTPQEREMARATANDMAETVLADRLIFAASVPANAKELRFAYAEKYHAMAEDAATGRPFDLGDIEKNATNAAGNLGMDEKARKKIDSSALGSVRQAYHNQESEAAFAGDLETVKACIRASNMLGVEQTKGSHSRNAAMQTRIDKSSIPQAKRDLAWKTIIAAEAE